MEWRVHDKTHLEFAIDYPLTEKACDYTWEGFFFVPESFRLDVVSYDKKEIYDDLLSYVRLAVPEVPFADLGDKREDRAPRLADWPDGDTLLRDLEASIAAAEKGGSKSEAAWSVIRRARVFSCMVRASGLEAQRALLDDLEGAQNEATALGLVGSFVRNVERVASAYRRVLAEAEKLALPEDVKVALLWVDEDISLMLEALVATASVRLGERTPKETFGAAAARLAASAVAEARYRVEREYPSVGHAHASAREVEHIEFRRHMLKRFTSSVLWLNHEVSDNSTWILHGLYSLAAMLAMAFAVWAVVIAGNVQEFLTPSVLILIASYAVKDRMKALLQAAFSKWAARRFPDRRWVIRDVERKTTIGQVLERAAFRPFSALPEGVLEARRLTRAHSLEEFARPEKVLWHEKALDLEPKQKGMLPSPMLTEIYRLNIGPWLAHTDDPNRTITFADPDSKSVYSAVARRVYNINVVYRVRRDNEPSEWKRIRVVVSRKGIERIDPII